MLKKFKEPGLKSPVLLFLCLVLSAGAAVTGWSLVHNSKGLDPRIKEVCGLIFAKHYLGAEKIKDWFSECIATDIGDSSDSSVLKNLIEVINILPGSHLELFTPEEDKEAWSGLAGHTGLFVRGVNGRFFIYKVSPESAAQGQVRPGDEVVGIEGLKILNSNSIERHGGKYEFLRGQFNFVLQVDLKEIHLDGPPEVLNLGFGRKKIEISSFRREYFSKSTWKNILNQIQSAKEIVIDLRGNRGGDFGALTRALSGFICESNDLGVLRSPRADENTYHILPDDDSEDPLIPWIGHVSLVRLKRFDGYPCYNGKISILVDRNTASVAEIFAGLMKGQPRTKILGQPTSGEALVGVWYELKSFKLPHTLAIPEATFETHQGENIEGKGVMPDHFLFYEAKDLSRGRDSWLEFKK